MKVLREICPQAVQHQRASIRPPLLNSEDLRRRGPRNASTGSWPATHWRRCRQATEEFERERIARRYLDLYAEVVQQAADPVV